MSFERSSLRHTHSHHWVPQEHQLPFKEGNKGKIALLTGRIEVSGRLLTETDTDRAEKKGKKLKEIVITDPSGQKAVIKVKHLAKAIHLSERNVKRLVKKGQLETHLSNLERSLEFEGKDISSKFGKITSKALFVLKENESTFVRVGEQKVLITQGQEAIFSKKVEVLGKGNFGKVSHFESTIGNTAVKFAKINRKAIKKKTKAIEDVKNEVEVLEHVHGSERRHTTGIQDKPHSIINIFSKSIFKKGRIKKRGYMGTLYDGDARKLGGIRGIEALKVMDQLFKGLAHLQSKNVVHGDIKPQNMLFRTEQETNEYIVHLSDFGGSRILTSRTPKDRFMTGAHTPRYLRRDDIKLLISARKRLTQEDNNFNKSVIRNLFFKMDVYATALSVYEIITGDKKHPKPSNLIYYGIPPQIANLIKQALNRDYSQRPTPEQFIKALAPYINQA